MLSRCLSLGRQLLNPGVPGRARTRPLPPTTQVFCVKLHENLNYSPRHLYSTVEPPDDITVNYRHGLPLITLTLPSRKERCQFVVRPMLSTVGSFLQDIQDEDKGVKTAAIFTTDGSEIPASTLMDVLLMKDFKLVINEIEYDVQCPQKEKPSNVHMPEMESVKSLVHGLFTVLHLEESQKKREQHLLEKIDHLKEQLQPLEQNYTYTSVRSRQFLQFFHKKSQQQHFDVEQYNKLKDDLAMAKESLERVRHSLYLRMQVEELSEKN
ncbi:calcium uniporter regulatory subunit MCUb, mitochondrial isoform X3 [Sciurus carolinensis]|uniref:calcium uniporter regulatory subunit MCUb, mitochondrial isoform X3 n=1 Tax=Sciurus carolinensis TaxID=30640 RepID=UPI001FB55F09|nr:calcium uniporter regulatory subunit MCUb, mitochondrial isoform X3 [Sciurus carolinensis]